MPTGMGDEERFAAAVERGTAPASAHDASSVARELEIVGRLRSTGPAFAPDPAARTRAKQRLMAAFAQEFGGVTDTAVTMGGATESTGPLQVLAPVALAAREAPARHAEPTPLRRGGRHAVPEPEPEPVEEPAAEPEVAELDDVRRRRTARPATGGHRRAAVLGAAAAAALVALAGTSTFASQNALPGDSMYGVKRVAESTGLALTFGEQAKARRHLEQAQRRLDEVQGMVTRGRTARASGPSTTASNPQLVRDTMREFDADTSEGSRLLLAGPQPDHAKVDEVRTWATQQSERLSELRSTTPALDGTDESAALLDRLLGQTAALQGCDPSSGAVGATGSGGSTNVACVPSGSSTAATDERTEQAPESDDERSSAETSVRARHDRDSDDDDVDAGSSADADSNDGSTSVRSSASSSSKRTSRSDDEDDRRQRDDGGDSGGSSGPDDLSVPLGVPVRVPSTAGLPSLNLGGGH